MIWGVTLAGWGIAEWYGTDVVRMTPSERSEAADYALAANKASIKDVARPECPFMSSVNPGALCNKAGGVCSIRQYEKTVPVVAAAAQPTTMCPNRFLEHRADVSLFGHIAQELFNVDSGAMVIKEIPFLEKETTDGVSRGAKAGRIDWIVVPNPPIRGETQDLPWVAIETQGVYFSGDMIWPDIEAYKADPSTVHYPVGNRRPDYRSSGAKRLAPQLDAKAPVMNRWGRKVVVVVDRAFFAEMGYLKQTNNFDNSEVVWLVTRYSDDMILEVDSMIYAELKHSIAALQAANPVDRSVFEAQLRNALWSDKAGKVFGA